MPLLVSHSRWNDLRESELAFHGYRVLTRSAQAGVDIFVKQWRSLFVFFQGHPEYEPDSLFREYRRDVGRFLRGETSTYPALPSGYFDRRSELELAAFAEHARSNPHPEMLRDFPKDLNQAVDLSAARRDSSAAIVRNWLSFVASSRDCRG